MSVIHEIPSLRQAIGDWKADGLRVALVPTMGNLHEGHLTLVDAALEVADRVVVSVFVNPTQFGAGEDFDAYPRTLESDVEKVVGRGAQLVFAPSVNEVYPLGMSDLTRVEAAGLAFQLCGAHRPGHFTGVATVVCKLFNMVQADVAVFGEKDFQQLAVIRRMVLDLNIPVDIVGVETCREHDGLAMSSRNQYLGADERATAPFLNEVIRDTVERIRGGDRQFGSLEQLAEDALRTRGFIPDYVSIRRSSDLMPPEPGDKKLVVLAAAHLGKARLIDNMRV
ncbi:MAG: pantoate--beta-alanine ligase [Gammaproteobacteria bacterium]